MRAVIKSSKHYVQRSLFTIAAGALNVHDFVAAVNVTNKNASHEVEEGAIIKAAYLEVWLNTNDTTAGTYIVIVEKRASGGPDPTTANMALLNDYPNKKNVLYTTQGINNPNTSTAIPALKFWVKIPKGKQRFGLGDVLSCTIMAQTGTLKGCGFEIYKEYQ